MTDDYQIAMDKKIFTLAPSSKGSLNQDVSSVNCKGSIATKQDTLSTKGNGRRRGGGNEQSYSKSQTQRSESNVRKTSPQKSKGLDRKSPRGNYSREPVSNRQDGPEVGSIQAPGAKKREWDNLFYFAPRERSTPCVWQSHNIHRGRNDSGGAVYRSKFSKENFLQANCQFMVKAGNDYAGYIADPDTLVDWNAIEQIWVTMIGQGASCPICLGPPAAAKMTRCGHIFCWPCMLHYLALSDQKFRPCPICYESICSEDLKSVVTHVHFDVELGDIIEMELLRRHKEMLSVVPLHAQDATPEWKALFSKLLIVDGNDVREKILSREFAELSVCLQEDPNCPEVCFVHQAIRELNARKTALSETANGNENETIAPTANVESLGKEADCKEGDEPKAFDTSPEREEYFYFYQDCNGRNIFLHPLNFSMLIKEFGSELMSWPRTLTFRIIDREYYSANEETRKRWKFLRHLPLSSPFIIVEVDLEEYVSSAVIAEFTSQIQYRKSRREQRLKEEKRMEKIIAERERKLWNIPAIPHFEPTSDFPEFLSGCDNTTAINELDLASELSDTLSTSFLLGESGENMNLPATLNSFAQIASRAPMKKSPSFPIGVSSLSKPSTTLLSRTARRHSDSEPESEDHVAVPQFRTSMSDAITKAFENMVFDDEKDKSENSQRKKKKNKGKVLFATGGMGSFN